MARVLAQAELAGTTWERAVAAGAWGGTELAGLAAEFGTPCYVYAAPLISAAAAHQRRLAESIGAQVHYAMKANGNLAVLQAIAQCGIGFDAASELELARCAAIGVPGRRVIVTGPGKSAALIELALRGEVAELVADNAQEVARIAAAGPATVGVRVNPDIDAGTHPHIATGHGHSKFGIEPREVADVCAAIAQAPGLRLGSLGAHIGSQIASSAPYVQTARRLLALQEELAQRGLRPTCIDLGGGFGIGTSARRPGTDVFAELVGWLAANCPRQRFAFQPGRSLVGRAGILLTKVEYRKGRHLIVDAGMTELIRPALYGAQHGVAKLGEAPAGSGHVHVAGPVCESADFLARDVDLDAQPGDLLAVFDAGAYAGAMMSNYNGRLRAAEIMLDGSQAQLARRRETAAEALAAERGL